jgi:uncharacterized protein YdeI (YjbR/CyaY-like superfamily)
MKGARTAEEFILDNPGWKDELTLLRSVFLSAKVEETIKWGIPVYVSHGSNITGMAAFKSYVGIWFYQGALLDDYAGKLINAQEGVTKALRQWRFTSLKEIEESQVVIVDYVQQAIQNQEEGKAIKSAKNKPLILPLELQQALSRDESLRLGFEALSLSKRRDFAGHVESAKRAETRFARLQKIIPMILRGEGLNDKYLK